MLTGRILVYLLSLVHGGGHLDELTQALYPALCLLCRASNEVQVAATAVEDNGEAALRGEFLSHTLQHLLLVPFPHRLHIADGDWGRGREGLSVGDKDHRARGTTHRHLSFQSFLLPLHPSIHPSTELIIYPLTTELSSQQVIHLPLLLCWHSRSSICISCNFYSALSTHGSC